jgi:hypothetical protein
MCYEPNTKFLRPCQGKAWRFDRRLIHRADDLPEILAEVLWSPPAGRDYARFLARLGPHLQRLDVMDVNYRRLAPLTGSRWLCFREPRGRGSRRLPT